MLDSVRVGPMISQHRISNSWFLWFNARIINLQRRSRPPQSYTEKGVMGNCQSQKACNGAVVHTSQILTMHHQTCASRRLIGWLDSCQASVIWTVLLVTTTGILVIWAFNQELQYFEFGWTFVACHPQSLSPSVSCQLDLIQKTQRDVDMSCFKKLVMI